MRYNSYFLKTTLVEMNTKLIYSYIELTLCYLYKWQSYEIPGE